MEDTVLEKSLEGEVYERGMKVDVLQFPATPLSDALLCRSVRKLLNHSLDLAAVVSDADPG